MKKHFIRLCLLALVFSAVAGTAYAQTTPPKKKKPSTVKGRLATKGKGKGKTGAKNLAGNTAVVAPKDTTKPVVVLDADIKLDTPRRSLRNDAIIERNLVKDRTPLAYEHIREDDAVYRQRVWQEIDVHEKMNLPFVYKATEDNGNQRFIMILLNAIKSGQITAFDATVDDRFTTPMTFKQIAGNLVAAPHNIQIPDIANDPDGSKGLMRDTTIQEEFNPDDIERYEIKEEWVFDKQSSRLPKRTLKILTVPYGRSPRCSGYIIPIFAPCWPSSKPTTAKTSVRV